MTATVEAIRDRVLMLIEGLAPTSDPQTRFRRYRAELGAAFTEDMEKNPAGSLRRVHVREIGDDPTPEASSGTEEWIRAHLEIRVAYPQTHRYGGANALDRDDVINQDWKAINYVIGLYGRGNFSGSHDCTPLGARKTRDIGTGVDYLVLDAEFLYCRLIA